ncbi:MAG: Holliday junction resolvase RuvX [Chloroflexota bacterium]|nr:Holliday junction resolvase RuvX [Chloroflexota bacterium]MDQ5865407.1 Holliday junction resolvase RuvX [Chloroflexota bacterium]
MKVLALDIGKRRIGVAVSDELGLLARPLQTVQSVSLNVDVKRIVELAQELGAEMVVVGDPLHMSGDPSTMSNRARKFGETLQAASGLPVEYIDERLTSVEAERILLDQGVHPRKVREQIDAVAASVILQSYLNSKKPPRSPGAPLEDRYW